METTQPQVETVQPQAEVKVKYKFNHQEMEEVYDPNTYQKGKNYDKLAERLQGYESDDTIKQLDGLASELGVSRKDILSKWLEEAKSAKATQLAESKDPAEIARELLELKAERDLTKKELDALKSANQQQEQIDHQIAEFVKTFPNVKLDDIPGEVIDAARDEGIPLKAAYKAYLADVYEKEKKALEEQLNIKNVNDANSDSSMGSATSHGETQPAEITLESIQKNKTNRAWIRANMDKIMDKARRGELK